MIRASVARSKGKQVDHPSPCQHTSVAGPQGQQWREALSWIPVSFQRQRRHQRRQRPGQLSADLAGPIVKHAVGDFVLVVIPDHLLRSGQLVFVWLAEDRAVVLQPLSFAQAAKVAPSGRLSLATVGLTTDVRSNDKSVPFRRW